MTKTIAVFLLACVSLLAQAPNCTQAGNAIAATGAQATINNITSASPGCTSWTFSYSVTGWSAVSVQLEFAPNNAGSPGSWSAVPSSAVSLGTNPMTSTTGGIIVVNEYYPFFRVNIVSKTGTGSLTYKLSGFTPVAKGGNPGGVAVGSPFQMAQYQVAGSRVAGVSIPNCADTGGNHLNFDSSTGVFTCGTSGGGSGSVGSGTQFQVAQYPSAGTSVAGVSIPNCADTAGQHLNFDSGTGAFSCGTSTGAATGAGVTVVSIANNTSSGTTADRLVQVDSAVPRKATTAGSSAFVNVLGICSTTYGTCGTSGNAGVIVSGLANCAFDNGVTAGEYFVAGSSGQCHGTGSNNSFPLGNQLLGFTLVSNAGAGTNQVYLFGVGLTSYFPLGARFAGGSGSAISPCNNDSYQIVQNSVSIAQFNNVGLLLNAGGTGCAGASGILTVVGGSNGSALSNGNPVAITAQSSAQGGNNSSVTGGTGGAFTGTAGQGGGFAGGTGSTGGTGGAASLVAGQGGSSGSGHANGPGGDVILTPGAAGSGAGTASVAGKIQAQGQVVYSNRSGSTTIDVGSLATGSNDSAGKAVSNTTGTFTAVITFARTWSRAPSCFAINETTANIVKPTSTTTTLTITGTTVNADSIAYGCMGY